MKETIVLIVAEESIVDRVKKVCPRGGFSARICNDNTGEYYGRVSHWRLASEEDVAQVNAAEAEGAKVLYLVGGGKDDIEYKTIENAFTTGHVPNLRLQVEPEE